MSEEKEKKIEGYQLVQVPTEHQLAVQTPDEKIISVNELMVEMANDLKEIKNFIEK